MKAFSASPFEALRSMWRNRELIRAMTWREIAGRYRGSALGMLWSFISPLLMLGIYTFVFSVVFKARWSDASSSRSDFALGLFAGMLVFSVFSECVTRAPGLVLANPNYVKKVVFPLEILPVVSLGSSLFHMAIGLVVWLLFHLVAAGPPPVTALLVPVVVLPLAMLALGLSWLLAALGGVPSRHLAGHGDRRDGTDVPVAALLPGLGVAAGVSVGAAAEPADAVDRDDARRAVARRVASVAVAGCLVRVRHRRLRGWVRGVPEAAKGVRGCHLSR